MNEGEFRDRIHKFRGEVAGELTFEPSIELLLDSDFCQGIDRIVHAVGGTRWERRVAVEDLGNSLPDVRGLYLFVWRPSFQFRFAAEPFSERLSWILYVGKAGIEGGQSDTIRHRYLVEYRKYVGGDPSQLWDTKDANRAQRLATYLTLRPLEYWFLPLEEPRDVEVLERKLLRMFRPPLNRQYGGPRMRPGKPEPAFEEPK